MPEPDNTPGERPTEEAPHASVTAVRPFLEAGNAYFHQLHEGCQAAERGLKDAWSAHAKANESLLRELRQSITDAARRYEDELRASSQAPPEERRRAAFAAFNRYLSDVGLAQTTATLKWIDLGHELENTIRGLQQSSADRSRAAYHNYLNSLKPAWRSVNVEQLPAGLLEYISRSIDHVARYAWYTTEIRRT